MKNIQSSLILLACLIYASGINAQCFSEQTFMTPGQTTFTTPGTSASSHLIEIEVKGGDGGDFIWSGNPQTNGGEGATMKGSFIVPGGSDLLVIVGSSGMDAPGSPGGGGGGGGSAVIIDNTDVLIAAGAGGGGGQGVANTGQGGQANTNSTAAGGAGLGSSGGGGFNTSGDDGLAGTGGGAGTLAGQGIGGLGGVTAGSGGPGFGGGGGGSGTVGGGGGGYKGGDGSDGSTDKNGKGGDSFVNTLFSGTVIFNTPGSNGGGANLNGSVIITCIPQGDVDISLVAKTDLQCFGSFDGSIEVSASGGLSPYEYALNGGVFGDSPIFTGLAAGDYTVTVQDGEGDTDVLMVTLTSPTAIIAEIINETENVCFSGSDGTIEVAASGGTSVGGTYGYSINGNTVQSSGLFTNLANGFYVISIFDDNLCTTQVTTSITSPDDLEIIVVDKIDVTCFGSDNGSIEVNAFGGSPEYMYSINDEPFENSSQFFGLGAGTYIITVMDSEGCTEEIIASLSEPDAIQFDLVSTPSICFGDEEGVIEIVNISGGTGSLKFSLNNGGLSTDSTFTELPAGSYLVTVVDSIGCSEDQIISITSPDVLQLTVNVVMDVQCGGDSTGAVMLEVANAVGAITYSVDQMVNFTGSFENLTAGEHSASATDANGCTTEVLFEIQASGTFTLDVGSVSHVQCFNGLDGSFEIEVTDGVEPIQYAINGTNFQDVPVFNGLLAGEYDVHVVDSSGCVNTILVTIEEPSLLQFDYFSISNVECYGDLSGQIAYSVTGGSPSYSFENEGVMTSFEAEDTISFHSLAAGEFIASLTDSNGCELVDSVVISQNDSLILFVSTFEGDKCGDGDTGAVDLNSVGGFAPLTITLEGEASADGAFEDLAAGDYTANVTDDLGCTASVDFTIPQLDGLVLDSLSVGDVSCAGASDGFVEFFISNANGAVVISLADVMFTESLISDLSGGTYVFVAEDEEGCLLDIEVVINEPDPLTIVVTEANLGEGSITVSANGGTQPYRYSIDNKTTSQDSATFTGLDFGDYTIIVFDANGCERSVDYSLVGTEDEDFAGFKIYPNPVSNILHLECDEGYSKLNIEVINRLGQVVKVVNCDDLRSNGDVVDIDVNGIEPGGYMLRLRQDGKVGYRRIVVVK